jgi:TetR/AcrR family transcriptional regulator
MVTRRSAASRRVGRPAEQNRREVRARLGAAARELFARQGFEAVSLRQVAEASGVTPAMVHYYFGGKQGLWLAVLEDYLEEALGAMLAARAEIEGPGGLAVYVARHAELLGRQPWVAPLLFREVVLGGGPSADFVQRFPAQLRDMLRGAIAKARNRREISPELDTDLLVLSLLSAAVFPFLLRPMIEQVLEIPVDAAFAARWAAHAGRLFHQGAKP